MFSPVFPPARLAAAALALGVFFAGARAGAAIDLVSVDALAGSWEIALRDTERRCGMQLRSDKALFSGYSIAMPAGCRRAMPILADVRDWTLNKDRALELGDRDGLPVLVFAPGDNDALLAKGPEGETYELIATGRQRLAQISGQQSTTRPATAPGIRAVAPAQTPAALPPAPAADQTAQTQPQRRSAQAPLAAGPQAGAPTTQVKPFAGRPADLAGRYVILREGGKDVGCMLTLNDQARGPGGSLKAQLAPACRDQGIVVFDPLGWQLDRGRISLTARKGHKAMFEHHEDDAWWKDPKEGGKPLGIKKMVR